MFTASGGQYICNFKTFFYEVNLPQVWPNQQGHLHPCSPVHSLFHCSLCWQIAANIHCVILVNVFTHVSPHVHAQGKQNGEGEKTPQDILSITKGLKIEIYVFRAFEEIVQ